MGFVRASKVFVVGLIVLGGGLAIGPLTQARAQADEISGPAAPSGERTKRVSPKIDKKKVVPATPPLPAGQPPGPASPVAAPVVVQKLIEAHAGCTGRVEALAARSLIGTKAWVPVSTWRPQNPDKNMVSVVIAQNFGSDDNGPYGFTGIVAAPGPVGSPCQGYSFAVTPSPLSCAELQANILKTGVSVANNAELKLLRNAGGQIALIPTVGTKGCVLVNFHMEY